MDNNTKIEPSSSTGAVTNTTAVTGGGIEKIDGFEKRVSSFEDRIIQIKTDFGKTEKDFERLEDRLDRSSTFMMWITGIIAGVFFATGILVAIDYFHNDAEQYKDYLNTTNQFYTKTEVDKIVSTFKDCLKSGGWSICLNQ